MRFRFHFQSFDSQTRPASGHSSRPAYDLVFAMTPIQPEARDNAAVDIWPTNNKCSTIGKARSNTLRHETRASRTACPYHPAALAAWRGRQPEMSKEIARRKLTTEKGPARTDWTLDVEDVQMLLGQLHAETDAHRTGVRGNLNGNTKAHAGKRSVDLSA